MAFETKAVAMATERGCKKKQKQGLGKCWLSWELFVVLVHSLAEVKDNVKALEQLSIL